MPSLGKAERVIIFMLQKAITQSVFRSVACALLLGATTLPTHAIPLARLRHVRAVTQVRLKNTMSFTVAKERNDLFIGSCVKTLQNGKADIQFSNGTHVVLGPHSQLELLSASSATKPLIIRIFGALSQAFIHPQGDTRVVTSAAVAAAPGTAFIIRLPREDQTELTVTEGEVIFSNSFGQSDVVANQGSTAEVGRAPTPPTAVDTSGATQWTADMTGLPVEFELPLAAGDSEDFASPQAEGSTAPALIAANYSKPQNSVTNGKTFTAFLARSMAARKNGDAPTALASAQQAVNIAANTEQRKQGQVMLALAHLSYNDIPAARAVLSHTQGAIPLSVLGLCSLRTGNTTEAKNNLAQALKIDPDCYQAHSLLCLTLLQDSQIADAIKQGQQAVASAPQSSMAHGSLAMALFFSPDPKEQSRALGESRQAIALNPESPFALLTEGRALLVRGRLDDARDSLQRARAFAPDLPLLDVELGQAYLRLDQLPRAEKAFHRAVLKRPNDATARAGLGLALARQGKTTEAREEYQQALETAPHNAQVLGSYAQLLIREGHLLDAEELLRGGLGSGPDSGLPYLLLSESLLFQQKLVESGEYAQRAVKLLPRSPLAHYQLGRVYLEQERFGQAEDQFRQATIFNPLFAEARYALGLVREQAERGLDPTQPLGNAAAISQGGANQSMSLQNLQTPGAAERFQALLSDPTVVRTASRSFGDAQFDSQMGDDGAQQYNLSVLKQSNDNLSVGGITAERNRTTGVRSDNADYTSNRFGLMFGRKASEGPVGFFVLGQYEQQQYGSNSLQDFSEATGRNERKIPSAFFGLTLGERADQRTRILFGIDKPSYGYDDSVNNNSANIHYASAHAEIRHDRLFGEKHLVSVGAAFGQRTQDSDYFSTYTPPGRPPISFSGGSSREVKQVQFYARDDWQATPRFRLTAELDIQHLSLDFAQRGQSTKSDSDTLLSPLFLAEYQLDRQSTLRFRMRRTLLNVQDFGLLAPDDVFTRIFDPSLLGDLGGRGWGYDLEYNRSFGTGQFLRASLFRQSFADAFNSLRNDNFVRFQGAQLRYEGTLNSTTTFFAGTNYISAPAQVILPLSDQSVNTRYPDVPRLTAEIGLQFLSKGGWFLQPSLAYIGSRTHQNVDAFSRLGGLGIVNLRVGRRLGLRFAGFAEVLNAGDKKYPLYNNLQEGRQLRFGIINRF